MMEVVPARCFMYMHEKLQNGRMVAYVVGIVLFVAVVAWKFLAR